MAEDLKDLTTPELKAEAKSMGLKGYSKLIKSKLISLIKRTRKQVDKQTTTPATTMPTPIPKPTAKQAGVEAKLAAEKIPNPLKVDKSKMNEFLRHIRFEFKRGAKRVAITVTDKNLVAAIKSKLNPIELKRVDFK